MITSDHSGFAGVQSPQIQPPPANIPSSEVTTCIPETPNYDLKKKAETIDINRF